MFCEMLKSKIHRAVITGADLNYVGSLTLCSLLMQRANLREGEKVLLANVNNGARFETYLLPGNDGEVCLNGAAARLGAVGDKIIIMAFAWLDETELKNYAPKLVLVDEKNHPC
jgi:aspartate 1-decarboxylase